MAKLSETGGHPVTTVPRSEGAESPSRSIPLSERAAFSPAEFAALCGRSPTWAYRQIYAGRLKPISDCGRLLIPRSEVDSFLARKTEYNPVTNGVGR
ncbi:MAG: helix-turn-helix domain-containing protein [Candidatus Udaeobacter sp.]